MVNVLTSDITAEHFCKESIFFTLLHDNLMNNGNFFAIARLYAFRYPEGMGNMARIMFCWEGLEGLITINVRIVKLNLKAYTIYRNRRKRKEHVLVMGKLKP